MAEEAAQKMASMNVHGKELRLIRVRIVMLDHLVFIHSNESLIVVVE